MGYLAGLLFFAGVLYWIVLNTGAAPILRVLSCLATVSILATIWAITAWGVARVNRSHGLIWATALFIALYQFQEVFWGSGEMGFPWAVWALSQSSLFWFIQIVDLGDNFGLSLWVLMVNALIFLWWRLNSHRRRIALILLVIFLLAPVYGLYRVSAFRFGHTVPVAAVQGNIEALEKWQMSAEEIIDIYLRESQPLIGTNTQLAVWPETAAPVALRFRQWAKDKLHQFTDSSGIALFTGATDYATNGPDTEMLPLNAAFLIRPDVSELLVSAKVHLVPFGERIPGQRILPFLGKIRLGQAEFAPAKDPVVFPAWRQVPPMGCLVCFEVIFPEVAAELVLGGARLLTNVTQDGWFTGSSQPYQHLDLTRMRAIATRRSIVRAANSGISALILPTGKTQITLGDGRVGHIRGELPEQDEITLAVRWHRIWLPLYTGLLLIVLTLLFVRRRVSQHG
jgi:apolipoprotein N-acyltransferase